MTYVYLDVETTGLDPTRHEVWEVAYAINTAEIVHHVVPHHGMTVDEDAARVNDFYGRHGLTDYGLYKAWKVETDLMEAVKDATLIAANPHFDASFLLQRWGLWGSPPWRYRMLDIEVFAMPALGLSEPRGLAYIAEQLHVRPGDHTAAEDVRCLRECHLRLLHEYGMRVPALGVMS